MKFMKTMSHETAIGKTLPALAAEQCTNAVPCDMHTHSGMRMEKIRAPVSPRSREALTLRLSGLSATAR